ncbi:GNAT family N-acetyltransferase [Acinetobacter larvae]|uniref:GNAT family N-acetyltransferase n=1 Tax=Acinetobacter larvae TaxID=1789224 RepID=A0A1B2M263_9GAMM|nr:GNAT family N-acetyltransferase [Acinetobacter larvae]AOA59241.1 GNAT family N-acetyltransferase [Acinetobacter larvae]
MTQIRIVQGDWQQLAQDARSIREQVFVQEQQIPVEDEWDDLDEASEHFVVYDQQQAIATARLLPDHSIGRVAVLATYRGQQIGYQLMAYIIAYARQQQRPNLYLSAQVQALPFYERLGFQATGAVYLECDIPHRHMDLLLSQPS